MINLSRIRSRLSWRIKILISKMPSRRIFHYDVIIVRVCLIGDFVMSYDPLMEIKKTLKGKKVLLICPKMIIPFLENDDFYKNIIGYEINKSLKLSNWIKLSSKLRRISADTIYYPEWQRFPIGDLIVNALKAEEKIGMKSKDVNDENTRYFDKQYTSLLDYPNSSNEIKQMEYFIRETINPDYEYGHNPMVAASLCFNDLQTSYAVVSMSSSVEKKMWPIDRFAAIINSLPLDLSVAVTGAGKEDAERVAELSRLVDKKRCLINYVNRTTLPELTSLIAQSLFVIGNDSSAVHLAAATRVPSICILHGAHFNRFFPYPKGLLEEKYMPRSVFYMMDCFNCNYICSQGESVPFECLKKLSVLAVKKEVDKLLKDIGYENRTISYNNDKVSK